MSGGADLDVHLSIGEVLALLQEEFPDCTISKIRFLESQGLIQPDRTASGYRKFYEADIERLRWILRQQRDHFLPLKVIRKMLDEGVDRYDPGGGAQPTLFTPDDLGRADADEEPDVDEEPADDGEEVEPPEPGATRSPRHPAVASAPGRGSRPEQAGERPSRQGGAAAPAPAEGAGDRRPPSGSGPGAATSGPGADAATGDAASRGPGHARPSRPAKGHETPADVVAALQEDPRRKGVGRPVRAGAAAEVGRGRRRPATIIEGEGDVEDLSTAEELCAASGIDEALLAGLERYGLVVGQPRGGEVVYGREAHAVCRLAARYATHGVEPRHLRMYLVAAEREAGFIEQLAVPLLKQRNPAARDQAGVLARELEGMGVDLHALLLRRELGPELGG